MIIILIFVLLSYKCIVVVSKPKTSPVKRHNQILPEVLPEHDLEASFEAPAEEVQAAEHVVQQQHHYHREVVTTSVITDSETTAAALEEGGEEQAMAARRTSFLAQVSEKVIEWVAGAGLRISAQGGLFFTGGIVSPDANQAQAQAHITHFPLPSYEQQQQQQHHNPFLPADIISPLGHLDAMEQQPPHLHLLVQNSTETTPAIMKSPTSREHHHNINNLHIQT